MTRRQNNNKWSGGIAVQPAAKKFREQTSAGNVLALILWDQDGILHIDYLPKDHTINAECYSSLLGPRESYQEGLVLARQCPESLGTSNPEETGLLGLPMS